MHAVLRAAVAQCGGGTNTTVVFPGHSLGGAVACVLAVKYKAFLRTLSTSAPSGLRGILITFGQPKVFKPGSTAAAHELLGTGNSLRVVTTNATSDMFARTPQTWSAST